MQKFSKKIIINEICKIQNNNQCMQKSSKIVVQISCGSFLSKSSLSDIPKRINSLHIKPTKSVRKA